MSEIFKTYLFVALGSALGGAGRFWIGGLVAERMTKTIFPWNTFAVNVTGSFIIGILGALTAAEGKLSPNLRAFSIYFVMIGVCGGYTTFSSFSLQTLNLMRDGQWFYVFGNIIASVVLCLVAVWLGFLLGQILNR
jgi:CrcB protein